MSHARSLSSLLASSLIAAVIGSIVGVPSALAESKLASTAADGTQANGPSTHAALSPNGRYVAFTSSASNLVPGDANGKQDVFVKDLQTNAIARVSVATGGAEFPFDSGDDGVDISADGNLVTFSSLAPLAAGDTNNVRDVYVRDRLAGTTALVSVSSGGVQGNFESSTPQMSDDGRYVVFASYASNLIATDTNGTVDVFLHDRTTHATTRVSVSSQGAQGAAGSASPAISGNGQVIAFISDDLSLSPGADPWNCSSGCRRPYVHTPATGETERINPADGPESYSYYNGVISIGLDATGRTLAMSTQVFPRISGAHAITFDRETRTTILHGGGDVWVGPVAISGDGRFVVAPSYLELGARRLLVLDLRSGLTDDVPNDDDYVTDRFQRSISFDGRYVAYPSLHSGLPGDTNNIEDILVTDRDGDGDGMLSAWEKHFDLDPANAADAALDADGDGLTSLQEYQAGTHPAGHHRRYLAEGASNAFFRTTLGIANPNPAPTMATVRLLGANNATRTMTFSVPALGHLSLRLEPAYDVPDQAFASTIESTLPLVVDRTMYWNHSGGSYYGAHAEAAASAPSTTWFLAEGATHGNFDLFYLLLNPSNVQAEVTVTYLREAPLAPVVKTYWVEPNSRRTIYVDTEGPELQEANVSASIVSTQPIMVERAMYSSRPGQPFAAGHAGAAVTAPALKWYLAEGATGTFFDLYLLIANPGTQPADVTVTYLLPDGQLPVVKTYTANPRSRRTISVDFEDPRLANTPVGMVVESTNNQPVVVERSMWWPSPDWYEAHLVAGATATGTRWAVAGARVEHSLNNPRSTDTYILIANTSATGGTAKITLLRYFHDPAQTRTIALPPNSRVNVNLGDMFGLTTNVTGYSGVLVESNGPEIVVERATYTNGNGIPWSLGSATLATRLDP